MLYVSVLLTKFRIGIRRILGWRIEMNKNENEFKSEAARRENKKRWESPRLTRLDFPKTANGGSHNTTHDAIYNLS